jgi:hypothetical protein
MVAPAVPDGVRGPPPHGRVSFGWHLIIPLIIQPIRQDPPGSSWIDGAPNVSSPDQSGADQIDAEHQATDLAVWPWRCWPMPHLAVPFPAGHPSGSGRFRCRLSSRPLPQCPRAPAAVAGVHRAGRLRGCGCPQAASAVRASGPSVSAGCADLARNPGVSAEPDTAAVSAGRPGLRPGAGRTAALRRGHGGSPEQGRGYGGRRSRPSMPPHQLRQWTPTAACSVHGGSRTSTRAAVQTRVSAARRLPPPADTAAVSAVRPELRPPGDGVRTAGVHRRHRRLRGGCGYRKRSPDRWPLAWCRHRR